ncbi:MAG TPA: (4Fe-4S)-binding protein [Candidatus Marinimicrobia bacterium]|nr:(4Fe-4S)-binding protein [Candidatus Neomarinimicrobiota bacterium]
MNSHYNTASFYLSSGTGNSLKVASWMQQITENRGIKTKHQFIDKYFSGQLVADSEENLVGIFMPTHGFTAPWSVIKFVLKLPGVRKTHAIVVATQGRLQFKKFFIPGLSASATFLIALILAIKGYKVRGVQSINMPSNWMALHSGQKPVNVQRIIDQAQKPSELFIGKILSGRRSWFSVLNGVELILGLLLLPISFGYMVYGKEGLAKLFFVNRRCNGCGLCADYCPNSAIKMIGKKQPYPFWTFHCESCMRCMAFCPEKAIEVQQPLAFVMFRLSLLTVFFYFLRSVITYLGIEVQIGDSFWIRIVHYGYYLTVWYLFSKLLFWLSRIPVINSLFHYTNLTSVYRRYREPDATLSKLKTRI